MTAASPTRTFNGPGDGRLEDDSPPTTSAHRRFSALKEMLLPIRDATPLHTAVISAALVLDAILVVTLPTNLSGVLANGPEVYLVLPAAAALYLSLFVVSVARESPPGLQRVKNLALPALTLAWAVGLIGLIMLSGASTGPIASVASSTWLYPA
ncbi:MAG: hypothetical protein ACREEC_04100, partial [Thermoplasmata archaeon]